MECSLNLKQFKVNGRICSLYEIGRGMSEDRLRKVVHALNEKGMEIDRLDFCEYADNDAMRHLFLIMKDGRRLRYFELEEDMIKMLFGEILAVAGNI